LSTTPTTPPESGSLLSNEAAVKSGILKRMRNLKKWPKGVSGNPKGPLPKKRMQQALEKLADSTYPIEVLPDGMRRHLDIHLGKKYTWADVAARYLFLGLMTGKGGIAACYREMADRVDGRVMLHLEHSGEQSQVNILNLSIDDETALKMARTYALRHRGTDEPNDE
jgi:hypothetical protein